MKKLSIKADGMGAGVVICPQTGFGMEVTFCAGCQDYKGRETFLGETLVCCNYSGEPILEENEV